MEHAVFVTEAGAYAAATAALGHTDVEAVKTASLKERGELKGYVVFYTYNTTDWFALTDDDWEKICARGS